MRTRLNITFVHTLSDCLFFYLLYIYCSKIKDKFPYIKGGGSVQLTVNNM
jgi:hypothetical protein